MKVKGKEEEEEGKRKTCRPAVLQSSERAYATVKSQWLTFST